MFFQHPAIGSIYLNSSHMGCRSVAVESLFSLSCFSCRLGSLWVNALLLSRCLPWKRQARQGLRSLPSANCQQRPKKPMLSTNELSELCQLCRQESLKKLLPGADGMASPASSSALRCGAKLTERSIETAPKLTRLLRTSPLPWPPAGFASFFDSTLLCV